jgi:ferredoxin
MGMHAITEDCTNCEACVPECPEGAIYMSMLWDRYQICRDKCTDCCDCDDVCPVNAIIHDPFITKNIV